MGDRSESSESRADSTQALVRRCQAGDRGALEDLVRRFYPRVVRMVRIRLGAALRERADDDDMVQDAFVRIIEGIADYEEQPDSRWIDWVARLTEHAIANEARSGRALKRGGAKHRRAVSLAESFGSQIAADSTSVPSRASRREQAAILDQHLSEFPQPYREVVLLRDYAGCDWKTVAERMGRSSPEACQELYRRARRELAKRMDGQL